MPVQLRNWGIRCQDKAAAVKILFEANPKSFFLHVAGTRGAWCGDVFRVNPQNPMVDNNHVYRLNGNCGVYTILNESCSNTHTHTHTVCQNGATCKMGSCSQGNVWVLLRVHFWDVNSSLRPWFVLTIVIAAGSNARPCWFSPCWWSHYNGWVIYSVRLLVASNIVYILAWWCQLTWIHRAHLNQF